MAMVMNIMKRSLGVLTFALVSVSSAWCQEYFHPGMSWLQESSRFDVEVGWVYFYSTVTIGESVDVNGETVYPMYEIQEKDPDRIYNQIYIRNDGAKVYYREWDSEENDWRLMYDFGLNADEECEIWELPFGLTHSPRRKKVKCTGRHDAPDQYCGLEVMDVAFSRSIVPDSEFEYEGIWIVGIGSPLGVYYTHEFGSDGLTSRLIEVEDGDRVIYSQPSASVEEPMFRKLQVAVEGRSIIISGHNGDVRVYDVAGNAVGSVKKQKNSAERVEISLPGIYIVICDGESRKVLVR